MNYVIRQGRRIEVETLETGVVPKRRRAEPFVKVPLSLAAAMTKATKSPRALVGILVLHEAWKAKGKPFAVSNIKLVKYGVSREVKRRALAELESSGLILVRRQHKQAPVVTLLRLK
jgi:hypothetical protein